MTGRRGLVARYRERVFSDSAQLPPVHEAWLPREHALHRPRHGGRQLTALICALLFFATPTALWLLGQRPAEIENHKLAGLPSIADGWGMFTGLPEWATDQLIFRGAAIDAADGISRGVFGEPPPFDTGPQRGGPLPGSPPPPREQGGDEPTQDASRYRRVIEGDNGWLYLGFDVRGKCAPQRPLHRTIKALNTLRAAVEDSGRKFVLVVAPDKTTMVPQHLPETYAGKHCAADATRKLWPRLIDEARSVDLRPLLEQAARNVQRPVYSPNDTHWTDEGSVALAMSLVEQLQPGTTAKWQMLAGGTYTSSADLPRMIGQNGSKTNTQYIVMPDGQTNRTGLLTENIDKPQRRVQTPMNGTVTDRTLVFGDSFTKAASAYLGAGFSDVTLLNYAAANHDPESTINAFVESKVVVVQIVERAVAAGTAGFLYDKFIERLRPALAARPIG